MFSTKTRVFGECNNVFTSINFICVQHKIATACWCSRSFSEPKIGTDPEALKVDLLLNMHSTRLDKRLNS